MKSMTRRTGSLVAACALGLGGLAAVVAAPAGAGPSGPGPSGAGPSGSGYSTGFGMGHGMGYGAGLRSGAGVCPGLGVTAEQGTLTAEQKSVLASMAQWEKLAHDLYAAFAARHDAVVLDHMTVAEDRHLAAVRTLLQRYGVSDPTAGRPAGTFSDKAVQDAYDALLERGGSSLAAALTVGQQVERDDIVKLTAALDGLSAPDVTQVYTGLLAASERHLAAFTRWPVR
jgi:hypothetical protein